MMKNLILFAVFTISCKLMLADIAFGFPEMRMEDEGPLIKCPKTDKGLATLLPHEKDCSSYYMCQSGTAIMKPCPDDLHFNPKKKVCDFPERAGCTAEKRMEDESPDGKCPKTDKGLAVLLPHESDCSSYYMCQSGTAIMKTCPDDLHFNPKKKVCDFPERAGCTAVEEEEEEEELFWSAGVPHSDCLSEDPNKVVILPHQSDCSKFYICRRGLIYDKTCPSGLHFNPKLRVCDYPENAKCTLKFPEKGSEKKPKCPRINKSLATLLPHETDCTQFYICESGEPILRFCPDELHFNPKKSVCDYPAKAGCQEGDFHAELAAPQAPGSPSPFCPSINGIYPVFFPHPTNCSIYYMCGNGLAYEFSCPSGLHFNVRKKVCDYSQNANCEN